MTNNIAIVGGGFAGMYAAWSLARDGHSVTLIEGGPGIGGILRSVPWRHFHLDAGAHLFDLRSKEAADFFFDLAPEGAWHKGKVTRGSISGEVETRAIEFLDLSTSNPELCETALAEIAALKDTPLDGAVETFADWLTVRYGPSLAKVLVVILGKCTGGAVASELAPEAAGTLSMFGRIKLGSDEQMVALKARDPFFDDRLSVTMECADERFLGLNVNPELGYPVPAGTMSFALWAEARLIERGVVICTGTKVKGLNQKPDGGVRIAITNAAGQQETLEADTVFWSLPDVALEATLGFETGLRGAAQPVGNCFFAYEVPVSAVTGPEYLHDFNPARRTYRFSSPELFGGRKPLGPTTYILGEIPGHPTRLEKNLDSMTVDAVWKEALEVGYVAPGTVPVARHAWAQPVAFTMPKRNWEQSYGAFLRQLGRDYPDIHGIAFGYRGRTAFIAYFEETLKARLLASNSREFSR